MEKGRTTYAAWRGLAFFLSAVAIFLGVTGSVLAATLSYPSNASIYLSSPAVTLTIEAGSAADALTVNATSVAITLSSTTAGMFILNSPRALSSSTAGSGGSVSQTCSSSIETDVIVQTTGTETYILTPTGSACIQRSQGGNNNVAPTQVGTEIGGGGSAYDLSIDNGAAMTSATSVVLSLYGTAAYTMEISNSADFLGSTWVPYATTIPWTLASGVGSESVFVKFRAVSGSIVGSAEASIDLTNAPVGESVSTTSLPTIAQVSRSSTSSLAEEVAILQSRLSALLEQASQSSAPTVSTHIVFARNLSFGMTGQDVKELQQFLISQNSGPVARQLAAHGATNNFAALTRNALIEFQKHVSISPAAGYFGPVTRAYVNGLEK